ncbi:helix-hairpin-helix domain-containing protein [Enterococcus sp. BWB1-3]|uniref:helix-hairpin-helix domain-containing protein n=1 Tax=unclassified Enterococcus TaxID=2608891 RepID=UPI0019250292|nr:MULTISPECIES: helix-hairpin-helix domain-containing protein [unclassified Enterococcus]MBL1229540.1 helix-hairpin-helix domain-containing protein [Enterococcus sp. BWB1-3]MCB5950769.1 helix-hairpin-helix domain-containing protein [Enterococcus sp. BWT-B8]MCB5955210.1 helix-hairpin-helix domain-containing protein [Enterococcus sp. CWB-B31]
MKEKIVTYRYWLGGGAVIFCCIIFCVYRLIFLKPILSEQPQEEWYAATSTSEAAVQESSFEEEQVYVDVKGAVAVPGIYEVSSEMRVWDVLEMAGGLTESADEKQINLSQRLEDQMVIYVPEEGEEIISAVDEVNKTNNSQSGKIDLNTADEQALMTLSGIGEKKAQEIIKYREENGRFSSIEELSDISGIGEKTFEKLRDSIFVS